MSGAPEVLKVANKQLLGEGTQTTFMDSRDLGNVNSTDNMEVSENIGQDSVVVVEDKEKTLVCLE